MNLICYSAEEICLQQKCRASCLRNTTYLFLFKRGEREKKSICTLEIRKATSSTKQDEFLLRRHSSFRALFCWNIEKTSLKQAGVSRYAQSGKCQNAIEQQKYVLSYSCCGEGGGEAISVPLCLGCLPQSCCS